jgi:acyl-CoA thioesterase
MELTTLEPGVATARVTVGPELLNPNGVLHGAVLFAMVDTSMGGATMSILSEGHYCASIEVQLRFLRAVSAGTVTASTRVVHPGRRVVQLHSDVHDADGRLIATASGSFAVLS